MKLHIVLSCLSSSKRFSLFRGNTSFSSFFYLIRLFLLIFSVNFLKSYLFYFVHGKLTGITTSLLSGPGSNCKEGVTLHSLEFQKWGLHHRMHFRVTSRTTLRLICIIVYLIETIQCFD